MVLDCPHCGSEKTGFQCAGELFVNPKYHEFSKDPIWNHLYVCRKCWEGVVVKLTSRQRGNHPLGRHPRGCSGDPTDEGYKILEVHPKAPKTTAPDHVPKAIEGNYEEAMDSLRRQNWTSAGMMFRKVFNRATVKLANGDDEFSRMRATDRIKRLARDHQITAAMRDWANIIRLEGNRANYKEEFDEASAKQMQAFTEIFLIYAFTLPARVKAARKKAEGDKPASS